MLFHAFEFDKRWKMFVTNQWKILPRATFASTFLSWKQHFFLCELCSVLLLTHLALRNCLTTSRCMVISTICSLPRYIYTGDQNVWVFDIFSSEMAVSIRTWPSGISISCHFGQKYFMGLCWNDHFTWAKTSKYPKHFGLQCRAARASFPFLRSIFCSFEVAHPNESWWQL